MSDIRFMQVVAQRAGSYAAYAHRVNECLYLPADPHRAADYRRIGIVRYQELADVRDALWLDMP